MVCPFCGPRYDGKGRLKNATRVYRAKASLEGMRREIYCTDCSRHFHTIEVSQENYDRIQLQHFQERLLNHLAETQKLVEGVLPVAMRRHG